MSEHTPGPWIAASHQSHIVGIPIVAPDGRSIGFAATVAGVTPEGKAFNDRSLANAARRDESCQRCEEQQVLTRPDRLPA